MFPAPPIIETTVFARLPEKLRITDRETEWGRSRGVPRMHSFLEGPSFDRAGNLYCVDVCHGRIFRISPKADWEVFAQYDGHPNGLKIHKDGRIFVADSKYGVLCFDPANGQRTLIIDKFEGKPFGGLNDLVFADNGDLYFTDPDESGLENPIGRVFRLRSTGELDLVMDSLPYPNGLVLTAQQDTLYVAMTRTCQIIRVPLLPNYGGIFKCGVFLQLSGGLGPDGMAMDEAGNLAVVHARLGTVWLFNALGEPIGRIKSCAGIRTANAAFGGPDRKKLYITEGEQGVILEAQLQHPGRLMYSHR